MPDKDFTRRSLLAAGALAPLGLSAARAFAQEAHGTPLAGNFALPDPPAQKMRWAIVGLGNFAVGEAIPGFIDSQHSRMTAFVSGSPAKQKDLGSRFGVSRSGTRPVGRYSTIWRGPASAEDDGRTMRSTLASGER